MSLDDARVVASVCLVSELRLPHFASAEIQLFGGYEPKIGDKLTPLSLLAEAEKSGQHWKQQYFEAVDVCKEWMAERDHLQSRLDAVVGLADELVAKYSQGDDEFSDPSDEAIVRTAYQFRAALGGESPANDEELK